MQSNRFSSFIILLLICFACNTKKPLSTDISKQRGLYESEMIDSIPFYLNKANNIIVPVKVNNNHVFEMMLHTAEGSVSILSSIVDSLYSSEFITSDTQSKSWGGSNDIRLWENNNINIGNYSRDSITLFESKLSGPDSEGKIGPSFIRDKIIELNYDLNNLILHPLDQKIPNDEYSRIPVRIERGSWIFLPLQLNVDGKEIKIEALLHSGYGSCILLDDEVVHNNKLDERLEITSESQLKDSGGNIIKTQKAILPEITIDAFELAEVPTSFFPGNIGRQKMSIVGADILRRFNIIIDYSQSVLYVKPNKNFDKEYTVF